MNERHKNRAMHFKQEAVGFTGERSSFTLLFLRIFILWKVQTKYSAASTSKCSRRTDC